MTKIMANAAIMLAALALGSGLCAAHGPQERTTPAAGAASGPQLPVAEAARRAREQRKTAPHAKMVFTNDNLPREGAISIVGAAPPPPPVDTSATPEPANAPAAGVPKEGAEAEKKSAAKGEAYWRDRFAKLRAKLQQAEGDLANMQRNKSKFDLQSYSSPQEALKQSITRSDIIAVHNLIAAKEAEVANLKQSLADLEDELRKSGGDSGWSRE